MRARRLTISIISLIIFIVMPLKAEIGDIVKAYPCPGNFPTGLAFDGRYLWNADRRTDMLYKIDPQSGRIADSVSAPGYQLEDITFDGEYLWCLDLEENLIFQFDPATGISEKIIGTPCASPRGLTYDGHHLWLSDIAGDELHQISTEDGTTIKSFKAPADNIYGLAFDGKYLWAADRISDKIYLIDPDQGYVIFFFKAPGKYARGLAFDGINIWNCDYQSDSLYEIKIQDEKLFKIWDERHQILTYTEQIRNYGPGEMLDVNIYMATPGDRDNQKVVGQIIYTPQPTEFREDKWGQEIAVWHYDHLGAGETLEAAMQTECRLYCITYFVYPEQVGRLEDIPKELKDRYLVDDTKFAVHDQFMQEAVKRAVGDEKNPYWIARKIYQHINDNMFYELLGGWNIAPTVLRRGSGSCSEYSFVFISLCRAAGIPARYVGAVTVRGDDASTDDVFHRWCEIYLPGVGWFPVDPSGGDQNSPEGQAAFFGSLQNRFLITTEGGGGSEYLEWSYNSNSTWKTQGKVKSHNEHFGEWNPAGQGLIESALQKAIQDK